MLRFCNSSNAIIIYVIMTMIRQYHINGRKKNAKMSKKKKKKSVLDIIFSRPVIDIIIFFIVLICCGVLYFSNRDPEKVEMNKAKRIAKKYMREQYDVSLDVDNVTEGIMMGADYSVYFKMDGSNKVFVGVKLDDKKIVYDNYVRAYIYNKIEEEYNDSISSYWTAEDMIKIGGYLPYSEDKYLSKDKKIDYKRAIKSENFVLTISSYEYDKKKMAEALYLSINTLKENGINIDQVMLYDFSDSENYHSYELMYIDQCDSVDWILENLVEI